MNNQLDPAMPSLIRLNARPMFAAAFGPPPERRLAKRLLLELTNRFAPILAWMPLGPGTPKNDVSLDRPPAAAAKKPRAPKAPLSLLGRIRRRLGI